MTQQSNNETKPPEITTEEDSPLFPEKNPTTSDKLSKEKNPSHNLEQRRFQLGSSTLGWCIFLMVLCVIFSSICPENKLVENAFEAFKLIVMTILGYIFGSNTSEKK